MINDAEVFCFTDVPYIDQDIHLLAKKIHSTAVNIDFGWLSRIRQALSLHRWAWVNENI